MIDGNAAQRRKQKREQQRLNFPDGDPPPDITDTSDKRDDLDTHKKDQEQMPPKIVDNPLKPKWYASSGGWTAIFTAILCIFTGLLWKVSNETNSFNAASQRAMINFAGPLMQKRLTGDGKKVAGWQVTYGWTNSGKNPAKNAQAQFNYSFGDKRPTRDLNFSELPTRDTLPMIIGPGTMFQMQPIEFNTDDMEAVAEGKKHMFFWGWVTYDDGNPHSPRRLTEFCTDVSGLMWTGVSDHSDKDSNYVMTTPPCEAHNCYDDGCSDYDQKVK